MIARVHASILAGIDAVNCEVEADVAHGGEATIKLVGMAETHRRRTYLLLGAVSAARSPMANWTPASRCRRNRGSQYVAGQWPSAQ